MINTVVLPFAADSMLCGDLLLTDATGFCVSGFVFVGGSAVAVRTGCFDLFATFSLTIRANHLLFAITDAGSFFENFTFFPSVCTGLF